MTSAPIEPRRHAPARRPGVLQLARFALELDLLGLREILARGSATCRPAAPCGPASSLRWCRCSTAPGNRSPAVFSPLITGIAIEPSANSAYTSSICRVSRWASSAVACTVWPSCHRNSVVRRNIRVRSSQRTTLAHWLMRIGRSRYDCTQRANVAPMIVSLVGRTMSGSSSLARRRGLQAALAVGLQPMVRHHRALLGEALDVLGLLLQEAHRDEQREVGVLVPGGLEHRVEPPLDVLPDGVAPRLDDHAAADVGVLGQVGGLHDLLVPLGVVFFAGRRDGGLGRHGRGCRLEVRRLEVRER